MARLTTDKYIKPKMTMTENLSDEDIKKKLEGYERIKDNSKLEKGNLIRYFVYDKIKNTYLFRLGGIILNTNEYPKYIVLGSSTKTGYKSWCVQNPNDVIFFRKKTAIEIVDENNQKYEIKITEQKNLVNGLISTNKDLLKEISLLKNQIKKINKINKK
jgi:hypothetical protein